MILQTLKNNYLKTFTEPRLSGKMLPEEILKEFSKNLDAAETLDGFIDAISLLNTTKEKLAQEDADYTKERRREMSYHILSRIMAWNNEPPIEIPQ